jgi:putative transposase
MFVCILQATMYRRERHSVTDLKIHLVYVTKYRKPAFNNEGLKLIEKSFRTVARKMNFKVLEFNGEAERVHALIEYPPKLSISQIANALTWCLNSSIWTGWKQKKPQRSFMES